MARSRQLGLRLDESDNLNLKRLAAKGRLNRIFSETLSVCTCVAPTNKGSLSTPLNEGGMNFVPVLESS